MKHTIIFAVIMLSAIARTGAQEQHSSSMRLAQVSLLVKDEEEALSFYTGTIGFSKVEDMKAGNQRWVTIAPPGQRSPTFVLVKAISSADSMAVGKQAGSKPLMVLETNNLDELYNRYKSKAVNFLSEPKSTPWGKQVVLTDLYGNHLVLLQAK